MPALKKSEGPIGARNGRDEAPSRTVPVPRAWLAAMTALVVIPWLIVLGVYSYGGDDAPESLATPSTVSVKADPGPWGRLEITPILVSPPLEYVGDNWGRHHNRPDEWKFPGISREQLRAFLLASEFTSDQIARIEAAAKDDPSTGGLVVTPDSELVRSLTPQARGRLYAQLAKTPLNFDQANSFRFFGDSAGAWLRGSPISPETRRFIEPLIYRDGAYLHFADTELAHAQIKDPAELRRLAKTLLRQPTMLVRLSIADESEVPGLSEYWGKGGRRTDLRPLLESIAGGGQSIDILHLLPSFARNHLYRYPKLTAADLDRPLLVNCLWSALNFFSVEPDDKFLDVKVSVETLRRDYFVVESGFQLGDIIAFLDAEGDLFHVAVYVADDLVFSKNGTSPVSPWVLMPLDRLQEYYRGRSASPRLIYHRLSSH